MLYSYLFTVYLKFYDTSVLNIVIEITIKNKSWKKGKYIAKFISFILFLIYFLSNCNKPGPGKLGKFICFMFFITLHQNVEVIGTTTIFPVFLTFIGRSGSVSLVYRFKSILYFSCKLPWYILNLKLTNWVYIFLLTLIHI